MNSLSHSDNTHIAGNKRKSLKKLFLFKRPNKKKDTPWNKDKNKVNRTVNAEEVKKSGINLWRLGDGS